MIQRIQTIYLLIVSFLGISLWFLPIATIGSELNTYDVATWGIQINELNQYLYTFIPYLSLIILIPCLSLSSIFLFKKRILQMRLNVLAIILMLFLYGVIYLYIQLGSTLIGDNLTVNYKLPIIIPIINAILTYLAIRAIGKDEALVRSLSRIR
jgi:hypothetical protein